MDLIKKSHIFIDVDLNSKEEAFEFIAKKAQELKVTDDFKFIVQGFLNREKESSTGFEDGFAIPHARIKEVNENAVIIVRSKKDIEWESFDGKGINSMIALIVKEGSNNEHLELLSSVSMKLMDENFKNAFKKAKNADDIVKAFNLEKKSVDKNKKESHIVSSKKIVAITSCTAGIAHTYLAEEKLIQAGKKMGIDVRVETQGSKGVGTPLTTKEINEADAVVFGVDLGVDKSRFGGKKFVETKVANIIHNPEQYIEQALNSSKVVSVNSNGGGDFGVKQKDNLMKHILSGVSYMIPIVVLGGICLAVSLGIAKSLWGADAGTDGPAHPNTPAAYPHGLLNALSIIGGVAFTMMIPILGGFIANSIAGRAAIAPAMVASFIGNSTDDLFPWTFLKDFNKITTPMGFIGAIIAGIIAGYLVKWINTWKIPRSLQAAMPIFFIPLVVGIALSLFFIYILGAPIGWVMQKIQDGIASIYGIEIIDGKGQKTGDSQATFITSMMLGAVLGAMGGFDMGGPVNKIAFVTCSILTAASAEQGIVGTPTAEALQKPMGSLACGIPVAPLGMGITTLLFPKFFDKDSKNMGVGAIIMGSIGISEGAIPFAIRDPKRAIVCNVIGSAVAGGIGGALGVQDAAAHGGPIVAALGAIPYGKQTLYFIIAAGVGVSITCSLYGFWLAKDAGRVGSVKETHNLYIELISNKLSEKKSEIKDEINSLKSEKSNLKKDSKLEGVDSSLKIQELDNKINKLIEKIKSEKSNYTTLKQNAKIAYKEFAKEENIEFKKDKNEIKQFINKIKQDKKQKINSYKQDKSTQTFENKKEKVNYQIQYKNNIEFVKGKYVDELTKEFSTKSANYVKQYKQRVNF